MSTVENIYIKSVSQEYTIWNKFEFDIIDKKRLQKQEPASYKSVCGGDFQPQFCRFLTFYRLIVFSFKRSISAPLMFYVKWMDICHVSLFSLLYIFFSFDLFCYLC